MPQHKRTYFSPYYDGLLQDAWRHKGDEFKMWTAAALRQIISDHCYTRTEKGPPVPKLGMINLEMVMIEIGEHLGTCRSQGATVHIFLAGLHEILSKAHMIP